MDQKLLVQQLGIHIQEDLVRDLLYYYEIIKTGFFLQDWEKTILNAGKFCEVTIKILIFLETGEVERKAQFEKALGGSVPMMIWLGKQHLDQKDKIEQTNYNEPLPLIIEAKDVKEKR